MCARGQGRAARPSSWPPWRAGPAWRARGTHPSLWRSFQVWGLLGVQDKEGGGPPSCWLVGGGFLGAQGVLVDSSARWSPQTVADLGHTFSQRLPAAV